MTAQHNFAVFIGRFQPFHVGHLFVFAQALEHAEHLIVLVGSFGGARSVRNPFTFDERKEMITAALPASLKERVSLLPLHDFTYDDAAWVQSVTTVVEDFVQQQAGHNAQKTPQSVALVGHNKDETTYYLDLFPNWDYIEVGNMDGINATDIRTRYFFSDNPTQFTNDKLSAEVLSWLREFAKGDDFSTVREEIQAVQQFRSEWDNTPYPVIFTTTDALVRYRDEILLITRKYFPGKGLFALPGGFVDTNETLIQGCLRELAEETHLDIATPTLEKSLLRSGVFDDPQRSSRGRVITHCYYFDISHLPQRPEARADDDALTVGWHRIDALDRAQFFEDHYFIIHKLLQDDIAL